MTSRLLGYHACGRELQATSISLVHWMRLNEEKVGSRAD